MKELTKRKKIIGTIETVLAAAVIIIAVVTAPKLSAQKEEETSAAASETAAATQAATETEPEKTEKNRVDQKSQKPSPIQTEPVQTGSGSGFTYYKTGLNRTGPVILIFYLFILKYLILNPNST